MAELVVTKGYGVWEMSEQQGFTLSSSDESYRMLLAALDSGWQVEESVYLRPRWIEEGEWVLHFILKQYSGGKPYLITTRLTPDIERFVLDKGWHVD